MGGISLARVIRNGTWETNSSSTHSIAICNKSQLEEWENGNMLYGTSFGKLFTMEQIVENFKAFQKKYEDKEWIKEYDLKKYIDEFYQTYEEWANDDYLEIYVEDYITPNGEPIVCFGKFGYDG